jgi:hypothetical protein
MLVKLTPNITLVIIPFNQHRYSVFLSCSIFEHFGLQVDTLIGLIQPGSTPFKDNDAILAPKLADSPFWWKSNSTPSKPGSGFPDPDQLIFCTV